MLMPPVVRESATTAYVAVLLGAGFNDPPLRLTRDMRWWHLLVISASVFAVGVAVYHTAMQP